MVKLCPACDRLFDCDRGRLMARRERKPKDSAGTLAALRLELAQCKRQLDESRQRSAQLAEENDTLRQEFQDLFEEAPIPYVHEGLDSRFIRANRAAMRVLGIEPEGLSGTLGKDLVAPTPET